MEPYSLPRTISRSCGRHHHGSSAVVGMGCQRVDTSMVMRAAHTDDPQCRWIDMRPSSVGTPGTGKLGVNAWRHSPVMRDIFFAHSQNIRSPGFGKGITKLKTVDSTMLIPFFLPNMDRIWTECLIDQTSKVLRYHHKIMPRRCMVCHNVQRKYVRPLHKHRQELRRNLLPRSEIKPTEMVEACIPRCRCGSCRTLSSFEHAAERSIQHDRKHMDLRV